MVMQDVNHQLFTDSVEAEVLLSMEDEDRTRCYKILENLGIIEFVENGKLAFGLRQKKA